MLPAKGLHAAEASLLILVDWSMRTKVLRDCFRSRYYDDWMLCHGVLNLAVVFKCGNLTLRYISFLKGRVTSRFFEIIRKLMWVGRAKTVLQCVFLTWALIILATLVKRHRLLLGWWLIEFPRVELLIINIFLAPSELFCAFRKNVFQHISNLALLLANLLVNFCFDVVLLLFLRLLILDKEERWRDNVFQETFLVKMLFFVTPHWIWVRAFVSRMRI